MGCSCSHQEIISRTYKELLEFPAKEEQVFSKLPKGGVIVRTSQGLVQYGIPPESVKDSMERGIEVPEYYIIPENQFDFKNGMSLMEMEFPVYYNFFMKQKKTTLICDEETKKTILVIFQETLLGPKDYSDFKQDFINEYLAIPDMKRETEHFAYSPFDSTQKISLDKFLSFLTFDKNNEVVISSVDKENLREQKNV